eukprot:TRINITY_DN29326_c0_g1_i1.p1 TRINITY_DN29326_c0_g1~~TRINITY_DN29326_c0_g1_i1.p1  ORF type:complete len:619 (+),score=86.89 TRINITY_DN29326_c0_g1_i1:190-2046(+)
MSIFASVVKRSWPNRSHSREAHFLRHQNRGRHGRDDRAVSGLRNGTFGDPTVDESNDGGPIVAPSVNCLVEVRLLCGDIVFSTTSSTAGELRARLIEEGVLGARAGRLLADGCILKDHDALATRQNNNNSNHNQNSETSTDCVNSDVITVHFCRPEAIPRPCAARVDTESPFMLSRLATLHPIFARRLLEQAVDSFAPSPQVGKLIEHLRIQEEAAEARPTSAEMPATSFCPEVADAVATTCHVLVIDNGGGSIKAGLSGEYCPRAELAPTTGVIASINPVMLPHSTARSSSRRDGEIRQVHRPICRGVVTDWESLEQVWSHLFFNVLNIDPVGHPVLVTEAPLNPRSNREKTLHVLFESFGALAVYLIPAAVLVLYSCERGTWDQAAVVVDIGEEVTWSTPICQAFVLPHAVRSMPLGGESLSEYLACLLDAEHGISLCSTASRYGLRFVMSSACYVAQDFEAELLAGVPERWEEVQWSNGTGVYLKDERIRCPEALFRPELIGLSFEQGGGGLANLVLSSVSACPDLHGKMLGSIVLAGGGAASLLGLRDRLQQELQRRGPPNVIVKVCEPSEVHGRHAAWYGGSVLTSMPDFQMHWIVDHEYTKGGPGIVHWRCP